MTTIGVISDTHGLLRPEAIAALQGCELILHAGDIGKAQVLEALEAIAPVRAIRGNNDTDDWAANLPECEIITVGETQIYMLHDLKEMNVDAASAGHNVVISGHSHKPKAETRDGVLYLNPGSAGPRRFSLPVSVATLDLDDDGVHASIVELDVTSGKRR